MPFHKSIAHNSASLSMYGLNLGTGISGFLVAIFYGGKGHVGRMMHLYVMGKQHANARFFDVLMSAIATCFKNVHFNATYWWN